MIHSGIRTTYICIHRHSLVPSMLTYTETHTYTFCPFIICSALPCFCASWANNRALHGSAEGNKLALLLGFLKLLSPSRQSSPCGEKKPRKIGNTPDRACQHLFRKPICRLLLHTNCSHSFVFYQKMASLILGVLSFPLLFADRRYLHLFCCNTISA